MKKKLHTLTIISLLVLSGCGDSKAPTAIVSDFTQARNTEFSEETLIGKMVTNIEDNRQITLSQPVDIANYSDIDYTKVGDYELNFIISDDAGNKANYSATLTIEPTAGEQEAIAFEAAVADYTAQIEELAGLDLSNEADIKALKLALKQQTAENYTNFQVEIDEKANALHNTYISENDILLTRNLELVDKALAIDSENEEVLAYQQELSEVDLSEEDLFEQAKIYSRGLELEDALGTILVDLEINDTGIDKDLYDNSFIQVSACSYNVTRSPNAKVNIGLGDRKYYAYTNEYAQLAFISADQIIVQDESSEAVDESGQYCSEIAEVDGDTGTTPKTVISDSLGAASNSYNVIPAASAYSGLESIENEILASGGATDFRAYFTYPDSESNTPNLIDISYKLGSTLVEYQYNN